MTREEFEAKALALLTEAADGGVLWHFILLYKSKDSPNDTHTISDAPTANNIYEALKHWVTTYEKAGLTNMERRVFLAGKEVKEDPLERPN